MADSSEVDAAIVKLLVDDRQLRALLPDGVFWDQAAPLSKRFAVVSLVDERDVDTFDQQPAIEDHLYAVKAVILESTGANIKAAAKRIQTLLQNAEVNVTGYGLLSVSREGRIRFTEVDEIDPKIRWQHRGGRYRTQVTPT